MKRILFIGLLAAMLTGQSECRQLYVGTYFVPNALKTASEKRESRGGTLAQPNVARIGTSKQTTVTTPSGKMRSGTMFKFDITKKMQGNIQGHKWEIKESTDETGAKKFTMCLDRMFFLPGGLEKSGFGPKHTDNITHQGNMICFDLDYEKPIGTETEE